MDTLFKNNLYKMYYLSVFKTLHLISLYKVKTNLITEVSPIFWETNATNKLWWLFSLLYKSSITNSSI